jgi:pyrimidine operon attenuation protein / uracil phosphoribosyltransferase
MLKYNVFFRFFTYYIYFTTFHPSQLRGLMAMIMDAEAMHRSIRRIAHQIIEQHQTLDKIMLLGIQTRGVFLAERIAKELEAIDHVVVPVVAIDVKPFRDDLDVRPPVRLPNVSTQDQQVILVDDVLYTGRTIRAAMDAVIALGRPLRIQCAVLIDRGHRELPVTANYIGKNISSKRNERVFVKLSEVDGVDSVELD